MQISPKVSHNVYEKFAYIPSCLFDINKKKIISSAVHCSVHFDQFSWQLLKYNFFYWMWYVSSFLALYLLWTATVKSRRIGVCMLGVQIMQHNGRKACMITNVCNIHKILNRGSTGMYILWHMKCSSLLELAWITWTSS